MSTGSDALKDPRGERIQKIPRWIETAVTMVAKPDSEANARANRAATYMVTMVIYFGYYIVKVMSSPVTELMTSAPHLPGPFYGFLLDFNPVVARVLRNEGVGR